MARLLDIFFVPTFIVLSVLLAFLVQFLPSCCSHVQLFRRKLLHQFMQNVTIPLRPAKTAVSSGSSAVERNLERKLFRAHFFLISFLLLRLTVSLFDFILIPTRK